MTTNLLNEKYIAYIPLLAAAVALTFDVGFFYAINISFFTLFSLSEHILFALQALPAAMLLLFVGTMMLGTVFNVFSNRRRTVSTPVEPSPTQKIIGITIVVVLLLSLVTFLVASLYHLLVNDPAMALIAIIILPLAVLLSIVQERFRVIYSLLGGITVCLFIAFTFGLLFRSAYGQSLSLRCVA